MRKIVPIAILFFLGSRVYATTPFRFIANDQGSHIDFATATVNGFAVFDGDELSGVEKFERYKGRAVIIQNYVATDIEINISTCVLKFSGAGDFVQCQTKQGIKNKIKDLRRQIDESSDFPNAETRDLRERLGWLRSYYQGLP